MEDGQIRQNKLTGRWVVCAPSRAGRPRDVEGPRSVMRNLPRHDPKCPFCPENEEKLPQILLELSHNGVWQTRVVPNKYPVLYTGAPDLDVSTGLYRTLSARGTHEVIVESQCHNEDLIDMSDEGVRTIIETYIQRYSGLRNSHSDGMISIFRNYGSESGASLLHPHSQLVATHFVTESIRAIERRALRYYDDCGRCLFCAIAEFEQREGARIVNANGSFVCFVPFAAEVPCEMHIVPLRHTADFDEMAEDERTDLAAILRDSLRRLSMNFGDPNYNYMIQTFSAAPVDARHLHWYLRIRPRVVTRGGFEIGTGAAINPSVPEHDARILRGA